MALTKKGANLCAFFLLNRAVGVGLEPTQGL
jgi:hypothetical protein